MTKKEIQDYKDKRNLEKGFNAYWNNGFDEAIALLNKQEEAINYTRCSTQLPDVDKRKEIEEEAYLLNLQNLSGREDFEEAFRLGIITGIDETIEYLESKAIV